jgi:DNA-binding FadR family transcriptional regulator
MLNNPMQLIGMMQNSKNPMMMLQQLMGNHPQYRQIMQVIQGKNPQQLEQYTRNLAKNQGIDLNQLASQFGLKI